MTRPTDNGSSISAHTRVHAPTLAITTVGMFGLVWVAILLDAAGQPATSLVVLVLAAMWLASYAMSRIRYRHLVEQPLANMGRVLDRCAFDPGTARCGPQASRETNLMARAIDAMLDRVHAGQGHAQAIVTAMRDPVLTFNRQGLIRAANPAASDLVGLAGTELLGRSIGPLLFGNDTPENTEDMQAAIEDLVKASAQGPTERLALCADGSMIPVAVQVARIQASDGQPTYCAVLRDQTARNLAESQHINQALQLEQTSMQLAKAKLEAERMQLDAEQASRSKSRFLASVSHEIRTPMTAILGFAETLRDDTLGAEERREAVEVVVRNGEHLMVLIDDILDLSKIEAGRLPIEKLNFSVVEVVHEVTSLMRARAAEKQLHFDLQLEELLPERIVSDPTRLRQVLLNLCSNAVKFTDSGGVTVQVRMVETAQGPRLGFWVSDTGIGMSKEQQARLFHAFEQAEASTSRRYGGTGLGLFISQQLVELLGGRIDVRSTPQQGSTFSFTIDPGPLDHVAMLPAAEIAAAAQRGSTAAPASVGELPSLQGRVLLAEDGPDNQRLLRFVLERAGLEVSVVEHGRAAVELLLEPPHSQFDIVLMDMQMPIMDGYQATFELRRRGYSGPIVALTANAMPGDRDRCLAAGCSDFAAKPVNRRALLQMLGRFLGTQGPDGTRARVQSQD